MAKKRLAVTWEKKAETEDFRPALEHYDRSFHDSGLRESTIASYEFRAGKLLHPIFLIDKIIFHQFKYIHGSVSSLFPKQ
jgi:hypothetical protein